MCVPVTGPAAEQGLWAQNGAKLALAAVNKAGGVLGKQVELVTEDDQTTNPGIVLAFSKLAAQPDIVGFLGSIRSTQVHAMAPDVLKLGKPVMIGGTDPALTHMGNQWLFRFRPNDNYSGRVIADYGFNTLGKKKWAIVHSTDAFGTAGGKALADALVKLGTPAVLDQGYANQSQDFTPVVLAVKQSGADVLGTYFTFENDLGIFARQLRQLVARVGHDPHAGLAPSDSHQGVADRRDVPDDVTGDQPGPEKRHDAGRDHDPGHEQRRVPRHDHQQRHDHERDEHRGDPERHHQRELTGQRTGQRTHPARQSPIPVWPIGHGTKRYPTPHTV